MADCKSPINGAIPKNPHLFQPGENAREAGRKGGIRSGEERRRRKMIKDDLALCMEEKVIDDDGVERSNQLSMIYSLIKAARVGSVEAFKTIRDTLGEKPADKVDVNKPDFSALDAAFDGLGIKLDIPPDWMDDDS